MKVLGKCFPDRWIDVISHTKKGSVTAIFSQISHMDAVATGTQLPNPQTPFFFILSEKPEKPHSAILLDNIAHLPLPPLRSLKCRMLPSVVHFKLKYLHCQFSLYMPVWSHVCSSYAVVIACFIFSSCICVFKLDYLNEKQIERKNDD